MTIPRINKKKSVSRKVPPHVQSDYVPSSLMISTQRPRPCYSSTSHVLDDVRVDCALEARVSVSVFLLHALRRAVARGTFTRGVCLRKLRLDRLVLSGQEDDLSPR